MKRTISALILVLASTAWGEGASRDVYNLLDVKETPFFSEKTELVNRSFYRKEVGGLTCIRIMDADIGESFSCSLNPEKVASKQIFESIKVEAINRGYTQSGIIVQKSAEAIDCIKTIKNLVSKPKYDCQFKF